MQLDRRQVMTGTLAAMLALPSRAVHGRAVKTVGHGLELEARDVGPRAHGLAPLDVHPGGEIRDGRDYPFARAIDRAVTYDGFEVGGPHLLIERTVFTRPPGHLHPSPCRPARHCSSAGGGIALGHPSRPEAGPVYVLWSTTGAASIASAPHGRAGALERGLYLRSERVTVYRSHLTRAADGVRIHAPGVRMVETVIDGLVAWQGDHNDGLQMLGRGGDVVVSRCKVVNANPQTSCLNLIADRVLVEASYLSGGGWTVYAGGHQKGYRPGSGREVVFRGTVFGREHFPRGGHFGPVTGWDPTGAGNAWSDNRWSTGERLTLAPTRP